MSENKDPVILFYEKYPTLDVYSQNKLKDFFIDYKKYAKEWNGLTVIYCDTLTFNLIYPLLQILSPNIQTLSIGGDSTFHPISWTPSQFIIPDNI
jgi:hypothetical protein